MVEIVVVIVVVAAALVGVAWALRKKLSGKGGCCDRGCSCAGRPYRDTATVNRTIRSAHSPDRPWGPGTGLFGRKPCFIYDLDFVQ